MDIYELRNKISVTIYTIYKDGAIIRYLKGNHLNVISLSENELIKELIAIGSLDDVDNWGHLANYELSQWDALNIALRFELAREMDKEIDNSDIGKAIKKITDGQGDAY